MCMCFRRLQCTAESLFALPHSPSLSSPCGHSSAPSHHWITPHTLVYSYRIAHAPLIVHSCRLNASRVLISHVNVVKMHTHAKKKALTHMLLCTHSLPRPELVGNETRFKGGTGGFIDRHGTISGKVRELARAPAIYWPLQKQSRVLGHGTASNARHLSCVHT